ncbi:hypothetical protein WCLP8_2590008 [uncultured Gammaproteobacteria bacterium]
MILTAAVLTTESRERPLDPGGRATPLNMQTLVHTVQEQGERLFASVTSLAPTLAEMTQVIAQQRGEEMRLLERVADEVSRSVAALDARSRPDVNLLNNCGGPGGIIPPGGGVGAKPPLAEAQILADIKTKPPLAEAQILADIRTKPAPSEASISAGTGTKPAPAQVKIPAGAGVWASASGIAERVPPLSRGMLGLHDLLAELPSPSSTRTPLPEPSLPSPSSTRTPLPEPSLLSPSSTRTPLPEPSLLSPSSTRTPLPEPSLLGPSSTRTPLPEPSLLGPSSTRTSLPEPLLPSPSSTRTPLPEPSLLIDAEIPATALLVAYQSAANVAPSPVLRQTAKAELLTRLFPALASRPGESAAARPLVVVVGWGKALSQEVRHREEGRPHPLVPTLVQEFGVRKNRLWQPFTVFVAKQTADFLESQKRLTRFT